MSKLNTSLWMPILIGAFSSTLTGCGTKGPLYIPEQRYPQEATVPSGNANKIEPEKAVPTAPAQTQPTNKE